MCIRDRPCITEVDLLNFCEDHFSLYQKANWTEVIQVITTPETPETAMPIYNLKDKLWDQEQVPTIVKTKYEMNNITNNIESKVFLFSLPEDKKMIEDKLKLCMT